MSGLTAVEIGADTCALVHTTVKDGELHVRAADTLDPGTFGGVEAFTAAVRRSRRTHKLPRRCCAVVWGLPDGAHRRDPIVAPLVEPLTSAGFKVLRVVTPCNALGALARRLIRTGGAACWVCVNRKGVAIVVVRPGKLLYSHSFAWDSMVGASGSQAKLLQRYSLVAFLTPEVRRALAAARQKGSVVDSVVTCGNLPDLRALTMPLIEELDMEVETLDSLEGLVVPPDLLEPLTAIAPSIRMACASSFARETRSVDEVKRRRVRRTRRYAPVLRVAALLALLAAAPYVGAFVVRWAVARVSSASALAPIPPPRSSGPAPRADGSAAAATLPPAVAAPESPVSTPASSSPVVPVAGPDPVTKTPPPSPAPVPLSNSGSLPDTTGERRRPAASGAGTGLRDVPPLPPPPVGQLGSLSSAPLPADKPVAPPTTPADPPIRGESTAETVREAERPPARRPTPALLADPVPRVTAILVSADRRLATVGPEGRIIGVGDTVGRRVVVSIDDRTVLLREPSGVRIRVGLGGRVIGVEPDDR